MRLVGAGNSKIDEVGLTFGNSKIDEVGWCLTFGNSKIDEVGGAGA